MAEVGIVISAEDKASTVLGKIGSTGKASLQGIRTAASKATETIKKFGIASAVFNQVLELSQKVRDAFRMLVTDTVNVALEFRKIDDPAVKAFRRMEREAKIMRARIGDIIIPLAQGLMDAFNDVGNSVVDWINANRKLIATNIADYMKDIAEIAIKGVAWGVLQISRVWSGWLEIINLVQTAVEAYWAMLLDGIGKALGGLEQLVGRFNKDLAKAIGTARKAVSGLSDQFAESAGKHLVNVDRQVKAQEELERKIKEGVPKALNFVGEAHAKMLARIEKSTAGGLSTREEMKARSDLLLKLEERIQNGMTEIHAANAARRASLMEKETLARQEAYEAELANYMDISSQMIGNVTGVLSDFDATAQDKMKALAASTIQTMGQIVTKTATKVIMANAAEGASAAGAQTMTIPGIGLALAPAAAAAAFSLIAAFVTRLPAFATGGQISGPVGMDNLMARLTTGERIIDADRTKKLNNWIDSLSDVSSPGKGTTGGLTVQVQAPIQNPEEMSEAQIKRWFLRAAKPIEELIDDRLIFQKLQKA